MVVDLLPGWIKCGICAVNRKHNIYAGTPTCLLCECPVTRQEWKPRLGRFDPRRVVRRRPR